MTSARVVFHGVEIPESLLATELQNHQALSLSDARALAGRALAAKAVLLARARELGLVAEPERNGEGQEETHEEALIRVVLSEEVLAEPPSEAAMRAVYDRNPEGFRSPPLLEASHILIAPSEPNPQAWEAARLEALALISDLTEKPSEFARRAASRSACPSASEGGSLGQVRPRDLLPSIWNALLEMKPGVINPEPVSSNHGWHVLRLDHRSDGSALPFDYVRPHIALQMEARAWTKAAATYVDDLLTASAAEPGLRLAPDGGLADEDSLVIRASGLLGEALADANLAYRALGDASRLQLEHAAAIEAEAPEILLSRAIRAFLSSADDAAWTQLVSRLQDSSAPLSDALDLIVARETPHQRTSRTLISLTARPGAAP